MFNLGWGREVSVLELLAGLQRVLGTRVEPRPDPPRPGEVCRICLDASRAKRGTGLETNHSAGGRPAPDRRLGGRQ